jgi:hypothetical protein
MPGVKSLRRIQLGKETTPGTSVAATTLWRGIGTIEDTLEVVHPEEDVGILGGTDRSYIPAVSGELEMEDTEATFEQLPYILEAGIDSQTPAQDGAGTLYIYTYTVPTTTQGDWRTYTIEGGDDQQEEEMAYCFVKEFTLSGKAGEALMVSATWEGRQVAPSTFTGSLALPTVEEILFSKGKLFIDGAATFPATTQRLLTFLEMELKATTGLTSFKTGEGELYFSGVKRVMPEFVLDVTFEHDSTSVAEKAAWRAGTTRSVRLDFTGSAGTGTTYSNKKLLIDMLGKWEKFEKIGENDGNDIVKGTLRCRYNGTAASAGRFIITNLLTALP